MKTLNVHLSKNTIFDTKHFSLRLALIHAAGTIWHMSGEHLLITNNNIKSSDVTSRLYFIWFGSQCSERFVFSIANQCRCAVFVIFSCQTLDHVFKTSSCFCSFNILPSTLSVEFSLRSSAYNWQVQPWVGNMEKTSLTNNKNRWALIPLHCSTLPARLKFSALYFPSLLLFF